MWVRGPGDQSRPEPDERILREHGAVENANTRIERLRPSHDFLEVRVEPGEVGYGSRAKTMELNRIKVKRASRSIGKSAFVFALAFLVAASGVERAAGGAPDEINRLLIQGRYEDQRRHFDEAIRIFSEALAKNPDARTAAEIHGERGGAYVDKGELDKAMLDAEEAVRLAANYFRGYQVRGRVYRQRKQFDRALNEYNKALSLAPDFSQLYNNRGNVFSDKGEQRRAIQDYTEAIRREPQLADAYVNRGGSFIDLGEFDKAFADLNHALQLHPEDGNAYYDRAIAYKKTRDYSSALADYTKANEIIPHDPDTLNAIGWLRATCPLDSVRDGKHAVAASLEACRLTSFKKSDFVDTLAAAYAEAGDFDHAIQYAIQVLKMKIPPDDREGFEKRLSLYRERKPYRDVHPRQPSARR